MASIPLLRFSLHSFSKPQFTPIPSPISTRLPLPLTPALKPVSKTLTLPSHHRRRRLCQTRMSYTPKPATDRLISAASYLLPFFHGLQFGRHLFTQYPVLGTAFQPILPLLSLYRSIPYGGSVAFFALYLAVVRNPSFDRYVRFNAMQALVLDVLLALPAWSMLVEWFFSPGRAGFGYRMLVMGHNAVFVFVVFCCVYSLVSCILGRTPYLPFVADAASRAVSSLRGA